MGDVAHFGMTSQRSRRYLALNEDFLCRSCWWRDCSPRQRMSLLLGSSSGELQPYSCAVAAPGKPSRLRCATRFVFLCAYTVMSCLAAVLTSATSSLAWQGFPLLLGFPAGRCFVVSAPGLVCVTLRWAASPMAPYAACPCLPRPTTPAGCQPPDLMACWLLPPQLP